MLTDIVASYSLKEVIAIEESDRQFLALKSAWQAIKNCKYDNARHDDVQNVFLLAVIYNALISYQIAGSGELRWEEFSKKIESDFNVLLGCFLNKKSSLDWWYNLMTTSKYNKRLYNIKLGRLKKMDKFPLKSMELYYDSMSDLWQNLAGVLSVDPSSKTIVFAVKMFGYAARIVYGRFVSYPMQIPIPVDSRIRKLFLSVYGQISDKEIISTTQKLSQSFGIPPLHIDSIFWVKR